MHVDGVLPVSLSTSRGIGWRTNFRWKPMNHQKKNQHQSVFLNFVHWRNCPHLKISAPSNEPNNHITHSSQLASWRLISKTKYVQLSEDQTERQFTFAKRPSHHLSDHNFSLNGLRSLEDVNEVPPSRGRNITLSLTKTCCACARLRVVWSHDKLSCDLQSIHDRTLEQLVAFV